MTQTPVEELKALRFDEQAVAPDGTLVLPDAAGDVEIRFADPSAAWNIAIGDGVTLAFAGGVLELNMTEAAGCGRGPRRVKVETIFDLRIMIDRSMLEIYCNDGTIVFASRFYPEDPDDRADRSLSVAFACPGAEITAWQMKALPVNEQY